jgi:acetoacetate decarboxylase
MFFYVGELNIEISENDRFTYLESGIGVPVTFREKPGNYYVYMYLDKTPPIVGGREVWGWPKKDAVIEFKEDSERIEARVSRYGGTIIELTADLGGSAVPGSSRAVLPWINFKIIPSVKKGAPPDVMQLTSTLEKDRVIKQVSRVSNVELKFSSGLDDALGEIAVLRLMGSQMAIFDSVLDYGDVLFNYLTESVE